MQITRRHHVVVLHLGVASAEVDSLVDSALPLSDDFHFRAKETGFPDHVVSYSVQSLSTLFPHYQPTGGSDHWQKPSEFRRGGQNLDRYSSASKENLPPAPSFAAEASVHSATRLHHILDALPSTLGGETLLTILWPSFDGDAIPEDHVELFGALKRARDWFDARLFLRADDAANEAASLWCALIDATALSSSHFTRDVVFDPSLLWTGVVGDGKERFRLCVTEDAESTETREKRTRRSNGGGGAPTEADADPTVRLILSHSIKAKRIVPRHKMPLHRICSEPEFYLTPHSFAEFEREEDEFPNFLHRMFPSHRATSSDCVMVCVDFVIDGKVAPTNKENGAGRRQWDKLAASTSGSTNGEGGPLSSANEFVFHRPHLATTSNDVRDKRTVDFLAFPSNDDAGFPYAKLLRLRQELEMNLNFFDAATPGQEANRAVEENFLRALDRLPSLSSTDIFVRCVEAKSKGEDVDALLFDWKSTAKGVSASVIGQPSADADHLASPLDIFHLEEDLRPDSLVLDGSSILKEGEKSDGNGVDATLSAAGGLLNDVAALVRADIQDDPFCSKVRAEDILAVYKPRMKELFAKGFEQTRRRDGTSSEGATIAAIPWPDVKEMQWHGVYYNRGLESEEKAQEIHLLKTRCQPMETDVTKSRNAMSKDGSTKSSQSGVAVDHFNLFSVGPRRGGGGGGRGGEDGCAIKRRRMTVTPTKRRKSSAFHSPTRSSSSSAAKPKTPRKTPAKKDVFSPAAKKLLDRAKEVLTSPRKSLSTTQKRDRQQRQPEWNSSKETADDARRSTAGEGQVGNPDYAKEDGRGQSLSPSGAASLASSNVKQPTAASQNSKLDASSTALKDKERESRSERNKKKLKEICVMALKDRGVGRKEAIFNDCFTRLYTISKSFVKDLKSSLHLREEMRKIVESHVDLVITFEKNRA